jgi:xanthine dehydrogenase YagT iron-sulfur-binding subunit
MGLVTPFYPPSSEFLLAKEGEAMKTSTSDGPPAGLVETAFTVNGKDVSVALDPRESLLDVLRERLVLTGTKKGCDQGQCGACTVHLDGRRVVSCLTPAVQVAGQDVKTIEGVAGSDGMLHPLQQAFIDCDAMQCGYCTPGQVMSGLACLAEGHATTDDDVREYMSGNLCRCGAYVGIIAAIRQVAGQDEQAGE